MARGIAIPRDVARAGQSAVKHYRTCIRRGSSPRLAELFALRQAPGLNTDATFLAGRGTLQDQFKGDEIVLDQITKTAKRHGYNPNANDVYISSLAQFPGDPKAFVPPTNAKGHVRKVCEDRGWSCHGSVNVKGTAKNDDPGEGIKLADDLAEANVKRMVKKDPSLARKATKKELKAEAVLRHGRR